MIGDGVERIVLFLEVADEVEWTLGMVSPLLSPDVRTCVLAVMFSDLSIIPCDLDRRPKFPSI